MLPARMRAPIHAAVAVWIAFVTAATAGCGTGDASAPVVAATAPAVKVSAPVREAALASARVWAAPPVAVSRADLSINPPGGLEPDDVVSCRFNTKPVGGTTPKFYCDLETGETIKIKYGQGNPELNAEVASTRLLTALGFPADRMFVVRRVKCAGCPAYPFQALRCLDRIDVKNACFPGGLDYSRVVEFDSAVVERRIDGRVIEATEDQGWGWYELNKIDPARDGSSRADVDAFRLIAIFLAHWDNKDANQRLICPAGKDGPDGSCTEPIAIMQDLGATFGPTKVDLHNWRQGRIWKDSAKCLVSMEHLPWGGGTFPEAVISEGGRQQLLGLLQQLSDSQIRDLFEASGITRLDQVNAESRRAEVWIDAFKDRVKQISEAGPCPS